MKKLQTLLMVVVLCHSATYIHGALFTVTNNGWANAGAGNAGDLLYCLNLANANGQADVIEFANAMVITPLTVPDVTSEIDFDGTTIPGYAGGARVEITNSFDNGLAFRGVGASNSSVLGMVFRNNPAYGIYVANANNITIQSCYIGTSANGLVAAPNGIDGVNFINSSNSLVGGTGVEEGNVISGNQNIGLRSENSPGLRVYGNIIGLAADGITPMGNGHYGIYGENNSSNHEIGGATAGHRNVISGNDLNGVFYRDNCAGLLIQNNYIGLGADGNWTGLNQGNGENGIKISENSINPQVISNVVSGNGRNYQTAGPFGNVVNGTGVLIEVGSNNFTVQDNIIGFESDGTTPAGNVENGVVSLAVTTGLIEDNTIGNNGTFYPSGFATGASPVAGSLPFGQGIVVNFSNSVEVYGNNVGVDISGTGNFGNLQSGIITIFADDFTIGATGAGNGNIIGNHGEFGIHVVGGTPGEIINNLIGEDAAGGNIGNTDGGIYLEGISAGGGLAGSNIQVGGNANEANVIANSTGNTIRFADACGVCISSAGGDFGQQDLISQNSIYCNSGLGIDLNFGNNMGDRWSNQWWPVGTVNPGNTGKVPPVIDPHATSVNQIVGTGNPGDEIQVFDNDCDCEGQYYLGSTTVAGDGSWSFNTPGPVSDSSRVTVIGIDGNDNTSEFTLCCRVNAEDLAIDRPRICIGESAQVTVSTHVGESFQLQQATNMAGPWTNQGAPRVFADSVWAVAPGAQGTYYYRVIGTSTGWGAPGAYTCDETTQVVQLIVNPAMTVTPVETDPNCGANDGQLVLNVTNGTTAFSYSIDDSVTFQASNIFNGLAAGTYDIVVVDADGCEARNTATLTSPGGPTITSVSSTDPTDCDDNDGTISIVANGTSTLEYSIDGGVTYVASNTFSNLSSTNNPFEIRVRYDDGSCEVSDADINLTPEVTPVITSVVATDPTNCQDNDGAITINATGSTGTLEYTIDGGTVWQAGNAFTALSSSGNPYQVHVRYDDPICEVSDADVNLTAPQEPVITAENITDPTDCGVDDGTITLTATGADGTIEYSIDGGTSYQASGAYTGLAAGNYPVMIRYDDPMCEVTGSSLTLTAPVAPVITVVDVTNPSDCEDDDGQIEITANGSSPLEYSIDGGVSFVASSSFSGLSSVDNAFEIRVRYTDGTCEVSDPDVNLVAEEYPVISAVVATDPSTCQDNDGTITINATGTTGTLEFSIDGGLTYLASNSFTGLASSGSPFQIRVRYDDPLCEVSDPDVNLVAPVAPVITSELTSDPSNCGIDDGAITLVASGADGTVEYSIDGGVSYQASGNFTGLGQGSYQVMVRYDNPMCEVIGSLLTLTAPTGPVISAVATTDPTNCDDDDGTITITASGANMIEYSIDGGVSYLANNVFSNLSSTNNPYGIRIRYTDGTCEVSDPDVSLVPEELPVITSVVMNNPSNCQDNDGTISISAIGATGTLEYSIDSGGAWQASPNFSRLASTGGPYAIRVRYDDPMCEVSDPDVTLVAPQPPVIVSENTTDPTNCGIDDGVIQVTATGSDGTIEYSIDGGTNYQATGVFNGLGAGLYPVMVRYDDPMCEVAGSPLTLAAPASPVIVQVVAQDPSDCDDDDGSIDITATGSTGNLEYSIDGGVTYGVTNSFAGLSSTGSPYEIRVRYDDGTCEVADPDVNLTAEEWPIITVSNAINPIDCDDDDGEIRISASGTTGTLEYSIDGGITFQAAPLFTGLSSQDNPYNVVVRYDDPLCAVNGDVHVLVAPQLPQISSEVGQDPSSCDLDDGTIVVTAVGVSGVLEYSIDGGQIFQPAGAFQDLPGGSYNVVVRYDDPMCEVVGSQLVLVAPESPTINAVASGDPSTCDGMNGTISIDATGSSGTLVYSFDGGQTFGSANSTSSLSAGSYQVAIQYADGSCEVVGDPITLVDPPLPPVNLSSNPPLCDGTVGHVYFDGLDNSRAYQVSFEGFSDTYLEGGSPAGGSISLQVEPGNYFSFSVVDDNNCQTTKDTAIVIQEVLDTCDCPVFIPTAFSPNADDLNNNWFVEGLECKQDAKVIVLNRYGDILYRQLGSYEPWDGKRNGVELPVGTYYYEVTYTDRDESKKRFAGALLLMR